VLFIDEPTMKGSNSLAPGFRREAANSATD
jgi:hypothetical protein